MLQLRHERVSPSLMTPSLPSSTSTTTATGSLNQSQRRIHQMLSSYVSTVGRGDFLSQLNQILHSRTSPSVVNAKADIQTYYANRPELRKYTLGVEMDRDMDYTLIKKDGQTISDKNDIRAYFSVHQHEGTSPQHFVVDTEELLIRAANQSLLADALVALTGSEEVLEHRLQNVDEKSGLILCGPILSMTSAVEKCHFTIDLQRGRVESICVLAISVPVKNRRLVLARTILIANFQPGRRRQLQYAMEFVKSHHSPLSKTIREAAISLANDQDNLLLQGSHTENAAVEKEAKMPQRSFSIFR